MKLKLTKSVSALTKFEINHASFQGEFKAFLACCVSARAGLQAAWGLGTVTLRQTKTPTVRSFYFFEFIASQAVNIRAHPKACAMDFKRCRTQAASKMTNV